MPKPPTIHQTKEIFRSRLFCIEELDIQFSNGEKRIYERLASPDQHPGAGAVLIVPLLDDETFLLIREFSGGTESYELGFPKGRMEVGEVATESANRELMEEVGYEAANIVMLKALSIAPQYMRHKTNIMLARNLTPHREEGDEPEPLEVVPWKFADLAELIERDDFNEARSLAALYLAKDYLLNESN